MGVFRLVICMLGEQEKLKSDHKRSREVFCNAKVPLHSSKTLRYLRITLY